MALIHTHIHLKSFLGILKSSALLESKNLLLPKIAVMVLFMFSLNTLFEDYLAKFFGFHDLGLINDFLANTVHRGKTFYVSTLGINHLSWHFSPSWTYRAFKLCLQYFVAKAYHLSGNYLKLFYHLLHNIRVYMQMYLFQ